MAGDLSDPTISGQAVVWQPPTGRNETSTSKNDEPTHKATITLTDLPAELRNYIFELTMPNGTSICLRVERLPTSNGKLHYRFHPSLSALYATCKQLRIDYPIARYYAINNFIVTDAMFDQPGAVSAFSEARGLAAESMTRLRVSHSVMGRGSLLCLVFKIRYCIDFAMIRPKQIMIQREKLTVIRSRDWNDAFPNEDEVVCLCGVRKVVADQHTLPELLCDYAQMLATRRRSEDQGYIVGERCPECGNMRFV